MRLAIVEELKIFLLEIRDDFAKLVAHDDVDQHFVYAHLKCRRCVVRRDFGDVGVGRFVRFGWLQRTQQASEKGCSLLPEPAWVEADSAPATARQSEGTFLRLK